jgi:hypothetical protein
MGREVGYQLGSFVEEVVEVDTNEVGDWMGEYLRVRIYMDVTKLLPRGRMMKLKDSSRWIPS